MRPRWKLVVTTLAASAFSCRSPAPGRVDAAPSPRASAVVATDAGVARAVMVEEPELCDAGVVASALEPLSRAIFPLEQREPRTGSSWTVPARIALDRSEAAAPRMLLGDATLAGCSALAGSSSGRDAVHGPFSGVPASDERWVVLFFDGPRSVVALVDDRGIPRFARDLGVARDGEQTGTGRAAERLDLFEVGTSVVVTMYQTADGLTDSATRVLGVVDGELRMLWSVDQTTIMGQATKRELLPGPRSATPAFTYRFHADTAPVAAEIYAPEERAHYAKLIRGRTEKRSLTFDPRRGVFR